MSAVSKSYTFVPGTDIESAEANQNFDDLVDYVNGEVIVRDASKAFTAIPAGPGTDPTSPNQFTRKQYVDDKDAAVQANLNATNTTVTNLSTTVTNQSTDIGRRLKSHVNSSGLSFQHGSDVVTTQANGTNSIVFPAHFNSTPIVIACCGDFQGVEINVFGSAVNKFDFYVHRANTAIGNTPIRVNWIAIGT